jgi:hypothetical protein
VVPVVLERPLGPLARGDLGLEALDPDVGERAAKLVRSGGASCPSSAFAASSCRILRASASFGPTALKRGLPATIT